MRSPSSPTLRQLRHVSSRVLTARSRVKVSLGRDHGTKLTVSMIPFPQSAAAESIGDRYQERSEVWPLSLMDIGSCGARFPIAFLKGDQIAS